MIRSRLLRIPGLIHAVVFALTAAYPGLPHGCEMGRGEAMAMPRAMEHQHSHGQPSPGSDHQKKCHCLGESCGTLGGTVLPPTVGFQLATARIVTVAPSTDLPFAAPARPRFLQPPALGPPASS